MPEDQHRDRSQIRRFLPPEGYDLAAYMGSGWSSDVYRCLETSSGNDVALKILTSDREPEETLRARMRREFSLLQALKGPGVIQVGELFEHDGTIGYSMELAASDLTILTQMKRPEAFESVRVLSELATALQRIHVAGIVHRNIKPQNILRMADGTVKIADFCLANVVTQPLLESGITDSTDEISSDYYPRTKIVDWRNDLYALGEIGYELLSGESPWRRMTVFSTSGRTHRHAYEPPPPSRYARGISPELDSAILTLLKRDPRQGFQSAQEFRDALLQAPL